VQIAVLPESAPPDEGRWLVIFDANGIYAQPAWEALPDSIIYLGPLEHYTPALIRHDPALEALGYADRPSPAATARYRERFLPEVRSNPGAFLVLGWADGGDLPDVARAEATIPPIPIRRAGAPDAHHLIALDRSQVISVTTTPPQTASRWISPPTRTDRRAGGLRRARGDTPQALRHPIADRHRADGACCRSGCDHSTVYGHWARVALGAGSWTRRRCPIMNGSRSAGAGQIIGGGTPRRMPRAHIFFALWSWDQSLYQPIPLGPLAEFVRGQRIPAARRQDCGVYRGR
jgi:hypothetical protein